MKTISKGNFYVIKVVKTKKGTYHRCIARGRREECMLYIIDFAKNAFKLGWSTDVQLSLQVFPNHVSSYFSIIKYKRNLIESLRIDYKISKYIELWNNKNKTKKESTK